ncbi:beta-1,3-galactosyltransferase 4 [Pelobates fuscus]|uniref:beta-1,3-galactosyltransferase 4 n=1 Tax=Pelobates fuscus TaxID=191477 RepID=UPI002FE4CE34
MLLYPKACLHFLRLACRRWSRLLLIITLVCPCFLIFLFSGKLEEGFSYFLPLLISSPSHPSSTVALPHPLPPLLISPSNACSNSPFFLILVTSTPSHLNRRDVIRQSWGRLSTSLTLFLMGVPESQDEKAALVQEAGFHGDIIQAAFADTYRNLTLKTLVGLTWAVETCKNAKFLLKTDDDVFVNTPSLSDFLRVKKGPLYLGRVHWHVSPTRETYNRHYTSKDEYAGDYFPPYCSGTGYILSQEAAVLILQEQGRVPLLSLEDVYVGILASYAGIYPQHSARIAGSMTIPHQECCYRTMYTSHHVTPQGMSEAWAMLSKTEKEWCLVALLRCRILGTW